MTNAASPSPQPERAPVGIVPRAEPKASAADVGYDFSFPPIGGCHSVNVTYHGGAIGTGIPVQLIFWGTAWPTLADPAHPGSLLFDTFTAAVQSILAGPWMSGLAQYGIKQCPYGGAQTMLSDPPFLPARFHDSDIRDMIGGLIEAGVYPEPDEAGGRNLYVVISPPNSLHDAVSGIEVDGAHSRFNVGSGIDVDRVWYAFVHFNSFNTMTRAFTHELAEMCTNPEGDGWYIDGAGPACSEIGDICNDQDNFLNGVYVESYWSIFDDKCIIPTGLSVRRTLALAAKKLNGKGLSSLQDPIPSLFALLKSFYN